MLKKLINHIKWRLNKKNTERFACEYYLQHHDDPNPVDVNRTIWARDCNTDQYPEVTAALLELVRILARGDEESLAKAESLLKEYGFLSAWCEILMETLYNREDFSLSQIAYTDYKEPLSEFLGWMKHLKIARGFSFPVREDDYDPEGTIDAWGAILNRQIAAQGICICYLDMDSDSSQLTIVTLDEARRLTALSDTICKITGKRPPLVTVL